MARGHPEEHKAPIQRGWTEDDMSKALEDIHGGVLVRKAAAKWKIPVQTLRDQKSGKTRLRKHAHASQQILSPEGEVVLVVWLQLWADTARPVSILRVQ
jgi:hypothetical protein